MTIELNDNQKIKILNSEDIFQIMQDILLREEKIDQEKEHFWLISLAQNNRVQNIELASLGSVNAANVEPMNVFRIAVMKGAVKVILVHNHPSGELNPSEQDKDLTDRLIQVGIILNIKVIDHLVISPESYMSFANTHLLKELEQSAKWVPQFELIQRIRNEEKKIREEAIKESLEKGRKEGKIEIARNSLKMGLSTDVIVQLTGLTETEIEELKK